MGEDVSDMATTTSQLQSKLLALTGGKVDIMLDENTFKNSTQILREMADAWEDMTDIQRASALELMGGKRQANVLSALISNFDTVEEAIEASASSAGSALRENEVFLDSFEGRMQQLTAAAQSKWSEALDTDIIKDAIQLFTKFIETLNFEDSALVDVVGLLTKALSGLMDLLGNNNFLYTLVAFFGARFVQKNGLFDAFTDLKKVSEETIESVTNDIKKLDDEIISLTKKAKKQSGRAQRNTLQQIEVNKQLKKNKQKQLEDMKLTSKEQQEVAETFDVSAMQKKISGKKSAITRRTNELTKQGMIPEQIKEDPKIQQWNKDIEESQKTLENYNNKIKETDGSLKQANGTLDQASVKTTTNGAAQDNNKQDQIENAESRRVNDAMIDEQNKDLGTQNAKLDENGRKLDKNTKTLGKGTGKLKEFGKQMVQTMAYMALIQGAMQLLDGIAWGFEELFKLLDNDKSFEELHDEFEKASSDLAEEKSELKSLEGELENVTSRIEEIEALGELSFTSQEELNNLQKQSAELERQIEMQKILTKNKQRGANTAALGAAKAYLQQSAETDKTLDEAAQESKETGEKWGSIVDGLLMVGGGILALTGFGTAAGVAMMGAGMAGVGKGVGGWIGEGAGESAYKKQQTNQQAVDSYGTKRDDYQKRLEDAYAKGDSEAYNKIKEEYDKFEVMMADNIGGLMEYLNSVDYKTLTDVEKADYEAYQRMVNQYSLDNGGSITDAVDSILGYDRYEKTGYEFDQIQKKLKKGDISSDEAAQQMQTLIDQSPSLQAEFTALDIKIEDVIASYVNLGKAAQQDASLMSSLDKITAATSAFDDLGSAVKEFREEGDVSAGTLESLNEKFGKLDEFEELYKVLATGEGDLETAVTNVANAYVGQVGTLSDLTDEELSIMTSRLKALGVLNAEEVLMARQKGQAQLDALGLAYSIDLSNYGNAEQAKLAIAQAAGLNIADIADNQVESLAKKYGVDLENYASVEEKKIAIAQARAKAEAQTDRSTLEKDYKSGEIDYAEYQAGLTDINNSLNFDSMSSTIQGIIDNAYQGFKFDFDGRIGIGSDFDEDLVDKETKEANEAFQKEMDYWENRIAANQAKYEQIQNEIDLLEAKGQKADASFYEEQIELENQRLFLLGEQKKAAQANLKTLEEGSEEWWSTAQILNDLESDIDSVTASIVDLQDAIAEIDTYKFEEFNTRLDNQTSKLETIRNLIAPDGEEDWFDDEGAWTEAGVAVLGSQLQQLEMYKQGYQETMDELAKYEPDYENNKAYYEALGIHSEQEYYDKTEELISQQYDYAQSISDTEQSVVDMYESNIDAVEEYTETLIDSYNDYIDSVKEALDAERDLYDFKKNVQKQSKDIAAIERRIASLSGSTNKSDIAERRKLEAQLYESRESLNDTYYDHAKNAQSEALDSEAEAYETSMNNMIEGLRTSLEEATRNMDEFLMGVTSMVMYNADTVLSKYEETNLPLTKELTNPWEEAKKATSSYSGNALDLMNQWTKEGGFFAQFNATGTTNLQSPWNAGTTAANSFKTSVSTVMSGVVSNIATNVRTASGELSKLYQQIQDTEARASSANVVVSGSSNPGGGYVAPQKKYYVTAFLDMGSRSLSVTKSDSNAAAAMLAAKIAILGEYEKVKGNSMAAESAWQRTWRNKVEYKTQYYAKGTTGTPRDEWAITDEPQFGDELVLVPGKDGNLSFMRKGTGVVPADMTQKLFELAQIPTSDLMNKNLTAIVPNITKNDFKNEFNFESLVHVDTVDSDTLPKLEKMVDKKIDDFSRALNYSLKKFSR